MAGAGFIIAAVVVAVAAVGSAVSQRQSAKTLQETEEKARDIEIRGAEIDRARRARRAIAAARIQRGEIIAASQTQNQGANSAVAGAVGSLQTQTAANIGAGNTQLATSIAASGRRLTGANTARRQSDVAGGFQAIGAIASTFIAGGGGNPKPIDINDPPTNAPNIFGR